MASNGRAIVRFRIDGETSTDRIGSVFHDVDTQALVPGCSRHALAAVANTQGDAAAIAGERNPEFLWLSVLHRIGHGFLRDALKIQG